MRRGGYQIIDLENRRFNCTVNDPEGDTPSVHDIKQYESFDSKIKAGKVLLVSGLNINGHKFNDTFISVGNQPQYYGLQPGSDHFTFVLNYFNQVYSCRVNNNGSVDVWKVR